MRRAEPAVLAALLLLAVGGRAQDPAATPVPPPPPRDGARLIYPNVGFIHVDPAEGTLTLIGDVKVQLDDIHLRCDSLVAWFADRKEERPPKPADQDSILAPGQQEQLDRASTLVKEVYAEGTVLYRHGEEFARCDRLFLDLVRDRGIVIDAALSLPIPDPKRPIRIAVKADELRLLSQSRIIGNGVKVSSCTFGHPHFHLSAGQLEVSREADEGPVADPDNPPPANYRVATSDNVLHAGSLPVFWLPNFVGNTAGHGIFQYVEDVRLKRSNRFGLETGITVGDDLGSARDPVGHWSVPIDYYSKRGPGVGVDVVYGKEGSDARGRFTARYQRDHGRDRFFDEPPTENRGRIQWRHRQKLPWELELDLELALFSDRGYYPTFFERENKNEKPPENLAYLKRSFFNSYLSLLSTTRFNDWETVVEYQPELRYDLLYEPLFDLFSRPVYLNATARVSKARLEFDEDLDIRPRGSWRADLDTLLEYALPVGPFTLTPFVGPRITWFQEDRNEQRGRDRFGLTSGATLATQAWKLYDVYGGLFGLDGLRHVVYPELTFRDTVGVHLEPDELIPFDDIDAYDNVQVFEFRMRNLLQTVRHRESGAEVENIVDLDTAIDYYPNAGQDNFGEPWSNLDVDLIVRFSDAFQLATDFEYDFYGNGFEIYNVAVGYTPSRLFQGYAGFRHFADTYDAAFVQSNWRVEEKWMITLESSYDFEEDRGLDHRLVFSRIDHDWVFQFGLRADVGERDYEFTISLEPRLFFDSFIEPRSLRTEPRLLYLGSGLTN